jgi:hypothetical protein
MLKISFMKTKISSAGFRNSLLLHDESHGAEISFCRSFSKLLRKSQDGIVISEYRQFSDANDKARSIKQEKMSLLASGK